jgi:hypothetical protein
MHRKALAPPEECGAFCQIRVHNIELGMGAGPYTALDLHDVAVAQSHWAGLTSVTLRYHFNNLALS